MQPFSGAIFMPTFPLPDSVFYLKQSKEKFYADTFDIYNHVYNFFQIHSLFTPECFAKW